jgi:hypothetical protein
MNMKTINITRVGTLLLIFFIAAVSSAAEQRVTLSPGPDGKGASGEAVITDTATGQKDIAITVGGLKHDGVYTVWFVTMKPKMDMAGVGAPDYVMKIDDKGNGSYTATVSAGDLAKWQMIEIAYHKTGDPKDMKKMGIALKGEVVPMGMKGKGM